MIKIIPSDHIEISTSLSKTEVNKKLQKNIQAKRAFEFRLTPPKNQKFFEGKLEGNNFQIQRIISGRNSFVPQIKGSFKESVTGTKITMDLKIHGFVIAFMALWLSGVGLALLGILYGVITQGIDPLLAIGPIIMFAFGIGLVHFGYKLEKEKSISVLKKLVEGQILNNTFSNKT